MLFFSMISFLFLLPTSLALWPLPQQLKTGTTPLQLSISFSISLDMIPNAPADLQNAVIRVHELLRSDKLQPLVPDRGESLADTLDNAAKMETLVLQLTSDQPAQSISEEATKPLELRVEGYTLTINENEPVATLKADTTLGLYRGLTTFGQLWYQHKDLVFTNLAPISIVDAPAYPYRGFMLDTARNFFPVEDIKRTLDAMSFVKLNTLHWHIVDSQSFPLVLVAFPELAEKGAYSRSSVYTAADVAAIVQYAAERGIDVLPEIDTPGHTAAIEISHPEHIACPQATPWELYCNEPPCGQLRIASGATVEFAKGLLTSAATMFRSHYFGTGGDEINKKCYEDDLDTQFSLDSKGLTIDQALNNFTQMTHAALRQLNKTAVVWEEMVINHPVDLDPSTIVMVWTAADKAAKVVSKGLRVVHSSSEYFYLDCGLGGWLGRSPNGKSWCDPFKTWQKAYSFDPNAGLSEDQQKLVLGGQSLLWTEQSGPSNLDSIVWPRAAASAEVFWSGPGRDVNTALPRLHDLTFRLIERGIKANPLQPMWCALRPGACDAPAPA